MKKILLADDSNTVLMLQQLALRPLGHTLVIARNGQEAVAKAIAEQPDLIVMDVVMPVLDGFGAVRRIREQPSLKTTPIIMVTTRGEPNNVEEGYAAGCTEYITKPFDSVELVAKLRIWLGE
jgi:CheY-like chemotaxis protein